MNALMISMVGQALRPIDLQYFWVSANQFRPATLIFANGFAKKLAFRALTPFLEEFYVLRSNCVNKLRITSVNYR